MVGDDRSVARQLREVRAKMRRNGRYARTLTLKAISQKDDRYPESGENWIGRGGRYSSFYRSTLKVFPRLNSSLDPCPELCRCRRCKTQLFKRAGAAKSVARCSVERTLANPGSLMELVGKEGEKMERRKGICFFFPRWHTRIDRGIDRSIDRHAPRIPKIALQVSTFFSNAASPLGWSHAPFRPGFPSYVAIV